MTLFIRPFICPRFTRMVNGVTVEILKAIYVHRLFQNNVMKVFSYNYEAADKLTKQYMNNNNINIRLHYIRLDSK